MAASPSTQAAPPMAKPPDPRGGGVPNPFGQAALKFALQTLDEVAHGRAPQADVGDAGGQAGGDPRPPAGGPKPSFASLLTRPKPVARLPDVPLPARQYAVKDGVPSISFSHTEHQALIQRLHCTLVAKFQIGRPSLTTIKSFFKSNWRIKGGFSMSSKWDDRHVIIILDSEDDVREALTCPFRKVQHSNFRLFRWTADYNPKKENTMITKWIKLPELPVQYFTRSCVKAIVSSFANFLDIDDRTYEMNALQAARACVELDVTKPVPPKVWVHVGDEGFFQDIVVEGGISYCSRCKLHGHELQTCRRVARAEARKLAKAENETSVEAKNDMPKTTPLVQRDGEWQEVKGRRPRNVKVSSAGLIQMQNLLDGEKDNGKVVIPGLGTSSESDAPIKMVTPAATSGIGEIIENIRIDDNMFVTGVIEKGDSHDTATRRSTEAFDTRSMSATKSPFGEGSDTGDKNSIMSSTELTYRLEKLKRRFGSGKIVPVRNVQGERIGIGETHIVLSRPLKSILKRVNSASALDIASPSKLEISEDRDVEIAGVNEALDEVARDGTNSSRSDV